MSGGSMQYLYCKLLHNADFPCDTPEREAFARHLKLVAQALHDIEWVDSGDYGPGDENEAIRACLGTAEPAGFRCELCGMANMHEVDALLAELERLRDMARG